jgi:hypothetical protein
MTAARGICDGRGGRFLSRRAAKLSELPGHNWLRRSDDLVFRAGNYLDQFH